MTLVKINICEGFIVSLSGVTSYKPLSPLDLVTMKPKVVLPLAGRFKKKEFYIREGLMSSGVDGTKKHVCLCRNAKNGICKNEISWLAILF